MHVTEIAPLMNSLPNFKPRRTRCESVNYGIPHSHKVQTKLYKISKFGVNQASFDLDTKKCMAIRTLSDRAPGWPYIYLLIWTFLDRCISVKTSLINTKLGDFVDIGVLFLTIWISSC